LAAGGIVRIPGTHNGQAALQARAAGFQAAYLSGAAMTASMGLPDLGMITVDDVCFFIRQVSRSSQLPVMVDGDTGYGEALNVMAMVRSFEDAGAAAVHIEDQILPKKCGHLNDKKLADARDMAAKVHAAAVARRHLYIVARRMPGTPLLANMTEFGRTPFFTGAEFEAMGYAMVIWPVSSLRVANKAQDELYAAIRRDDGAHKMVDRMQTRAELYATIDYAGYEALDAGIVSTVVPHGMPQR